MRGKQRRKLGHGTNGERKGLGQKEGKHRVEHEVGKVKVGLMSSGAHQSGGERAAKGSSWRREKRDLRSR